MAIIASSRRGLLRWFGLGTAALALGACGRAEARSFPVRLSDEEWKRKLTRDQYYVLRQQGTERAFTSPLDKEKRKGMFHCAGCDNAV